MILSVDQIHIRIVRYRILFVNQIHFEFALIFAGNSGVSESFSVMLALLTERLLWINAAFLFTFSLVALRYIRNRRGFWGFLFLLSAFFYVSYWILSFHNHQSAVIRSVFFFPAIALTYFFWILSLTLFQDDFRFGRKHLVILFLKFSVSIFSLWRHTDLDLFRPYESNVIPPLLPSMLFSLALVSHSMLVAVEHRNSDLVEERIRLRPYFILMTGSLLSLGVIGFLILKPLGYGELSDFLVASLNVIICVSFITGVMEIPDIYFPDKKIARSYPIDPEAKEKILRAFEIDRIHRTEGLTLRGLALAIGIQEYRLRRQINGGMGFRNFNDLLNRYRIQDACEMLTDPGETDTPVIRIAMNVGYPSPGPFNRAFRAIVGTTPTEYRRNSHQKGTTISK